MKLPVRPDVQLIRLIVFALRCFIVWRPSMKGHLYLRTDDLQHLALRLLNHTVSAVTEREISDGLCSAILSGKIVTCGETVYLAQDFAMEDETARHIAALIGCSGANLSLAQVIQNTAAELGISLSAKQHEAVEMVFHNNLSMITGSPGTGKTTVLKVLIHAYRKTVSEGANPTGGTNRKGQPPYGGFYRLFGRQDAAQFVEIGH